MLLEMNIDQNDDGWTLRFTAHDFSHKHIVCKTWQDVLKEIEEYFGWLVDGKWTKEPIGTTPYESPF